VPTRIDDGSTSELENMDLRAFTCDVINVISALIRGRRSRGRRSRGRGEGGKEKRGWQCGREGDALVLDVIDVWVPRLVLLYLQLPPPAVDKRHGSRIGYYNKTCADK
jgi:hypothetical protein